MKSIKLIIFALLLTGCKTIEVPTSDSTLPQVGMIIEYDSGEEGTLEVDQSSSPTSVQTSKNEVTIIVAGTDNDGGINEVNLWATFTRRRPNQIQGPGLAGRPIEQYRSSVTIGGQALKSALITHTFEMPEVLNGWQSVLIEVWAEAKNFHGGVVVTPTIDIEYPR